MLMHPNYLIYVFGGTAWYHNPRQKMPPSTILSRESKCPRTIYSQKLLRYNFNFLNIWWVKKGSKLNPILHGLFGMYGYMGGGGSKCPQPGNWPKRLKSPKIFLSVSRHISMGLKPKNEKMMGISIFTDLDENLRNLLKKIQGGDFQIAAIPPRMLRFR